jgi:hypothetical protein
MAPLPIRTLRLGKRKHFFERDHAEMLEQLKELDELNASLDSISENVGDSSRQGVETVDAILNLIDGLGKAANIDFWKFTTDDDALKWGKRRYVLLILGYILLRGGSDIKHRVIDWFRKKTPRKQNAAASVLGCELCV